MATFRDGKGRDWDLRLTVGTLTEVREATGVRLGDAFRDEAALAGLLFADPEQLGRVLWVVCRERAEAAGVTPEDFAAGFDGPALERAVEAFLGSVADFFPRSKVGAKIRESLPAVLEQMDRHAVTAVETAMRKLTSSGSATNSAASPAATPGR